MEFYLWGRGRAADGSPPVAPLQDLGVYDFGFSVPIPGEGVKCPMGTRPWRHLREASSRVMARSTLPCRARRYRYRHATPGGSGVGEKTE